MKIAHTKEKLRAFFTEDEGVTSIEYALLAALIFAVIVTAVGLVGENLNALYDDVAKKVAAAVT